MKAAFFVSGSAKSAWAVVPDCPRAQLSINEEIENYFPSLLRS